MRFMMIYRAVRQILSDGADIALQSNQRGDLAVQEQYVPDYELAVFDESGANSIVGAGYVAYRINYT